MLQIVEPEQSHCEALVRVIFVPIIVLRVVIQWQGLNTKINRGTRTPTTLFYSTNRNHSFQYESEDLDASPQYLAAVQDPERVEKLDEGCGGITAQFSFKVTRVVVQSAFVSDSIAMASIISQSKPCFAGGATQLLLDFLKCTAYRFTALLRWLFCHMKVRS